MVEVQAGITALVTAYARAYHATHDDPKIFDDFLADQLYTDEEHIQLDRNLAGMIGIIDPEMAANHPNQAEALAWVIQHQHGPVTLSRSRFCEDRLEEAVRQGIKQYVNLGAGFDTFAFRRPDLLEQLQVYELDHPVTQAMKRQRVALAGWKIPEQLHFIPIDFSKQSLVAELLKSYYDPEMQSFFSWQGVTYYLELQVVQDTIRSIVDVSCPGSMLVFDYLEPQAFSPETASLRMRRMQETVRQLGEPAKTSFSPETLPSEMEALGIRLDENLSPADIERLYFQNRQDDYHAFEHFHFARTVL